MNETENIKEILKQAQEYSQKLKNFKVSWRVFEMKSQNPGYSEIYVKQTYEIIKPEIEITYE